jgi:hypothetical protein
LENSTSPSQKQHFRFGVLHGHAIVLGSKRKLRQLAPAKLRAGRWGFEDDAILLRHRFEEKYSTQDN